MYSLVEEQGVYQISYPLLSLENLEIRERRIELRSRKVLWSRGLIRP
jgi:hypothetical protein